MAYVGVAGPVGHRPAAPGGPRRPDRRVVVDGPARRLRHRLRRPGLGAEDHRAAGRDRHPLPGRADLAGQGAARGPAARPRSRRGPRRSRAGPASRRTSAAASTSCSTSSRQVRARGWALADEELAPGVRSVAVAGPRRRTGAVRAAMNVTVHAAETSGDTLLDDHLPHLLRDRRRRQRRVGAVAVPPARGGEPVRSRLLTRQTVGMEYTRLGTSGLKVSRIALGCMSFGDAATRGHDWALDDEAAAPIFRQAVELGITFWDTANVYSDGTLGGDRRPRHQRSTPAARTSCSRPRCSSRCTTARAAPACPARRSWSRSTPRCAGSAPTTSTSTRSTASTRTPRSRRRWRRCTTW